MAVLPPRIEELIRRDIGATSVSVIGPGANLADAAALRVALPRGYELIVEVADEEADREALQRRLDVLVESFRESLDEALRASERPHAAELLHAELQALAEAAGASDAVVIDAASQVIWGAATAKDASPRIAKAFAPVIHIDPAVRRRATSSLPPPRSRSERVIDAVRALPAMAGLARGATFAHADRDADIPYAARSLGMIYVLILVFDEPFDQIRAERELQGRVDTIERLVLALPPLEPTPIDGAKAMRK